MKIGIVGMIIIQAFAVIVLSSCSFKVETGWHGQTGRDDRVISQGLYRQGISQERKDDQRY